MHRKMIVQNANERLDIDNLIDRQIPFAAYRIPNDDKIFFTIQHYGNLRIINDLSELDKATGFVIAPFYSNISCPILLIQPENGLHIAPLPTATKKNSHAHSIINTTCDKEYYDCFNIFIKALKTSAFQKLVLSRQFSTKPNSDFSPSKSFFYACQQYPHSYVYIFFTPQTNTWIGSTPEMLLSGKNGKWQTTALAATLPMQNEQIPSTWNEKQRLEQKYVSDYIRTQLSTIGIHATESNPYPVCAETLSHLKTDFFFSDENVRTGQLLKLLHPTPAVCGLPKNEAFSFIIKNEIYNRKYYSGFLGWIDDTTKQIDLYVNLRCMQIEHNLLTLYAGGGLLASSNLNDEWQETEKKLQTMKNII